MPLNKINNESLSSLQGLCIDDILRNSFLFTLFDNQDELEFCIKTELDISQIIPYQIRQQAKLLYN